MDRKELLARLAEAEAQVARGLTDIASQRRAIEELHRSGHDESAATERLAFLLLRQKQLERERRTLAQKLAALAS